MTLLARIVSAVRGTNSPAPSPGVLIQPREEDSLRNYPSAGLTPSRLVSLLREADSGSLSGPMQLFEEMEEKDAHLHAVANTRRLALTGLEWEVVSATDMRPGTNDSLADEAADYCRSVLSSLDVLEEFLQHLSLATGRNLAVGEIVWDFVDGSLRPVDLLPIDFTRIVFDSLDRIRILTQDEPRDGIELPAGKFIVHTPHGVTGHPQRGGLLRVTAMVYLAKNLALKDWMIYSELFGMPIRTARYEPGATADEKRELLRMLESLGTRASAIFSRAVELQFHEAGKGTSGPPYERLVEFLNREMSKAWLGQTSTVDLTGQRASQAATQVQEVVRQDILKDDIRKESRTIRRDLLAPMVRLKFGPDAPVPHFRRRNVRADDLNELARVLDVAVNQLGMRVPSSWAHGALGIPQAESDDPTLAGTAR